MLNFKLYPELITFKELISKNEYCSPMYSIITALDTLMTSQDLPQMNGKTGGYAIKKSTATTAAMDSLQDNTAILFLSENELDDNCFRPIMEAGYSVKLSLLDTTKTVSYVTSKGVIQLEYSNHARLPHTPGGR